jgi:DNA primase
MEKAGLVIRGEKKYYDRFRGRVMFPITNSAGQIVAFSGRVFHVSGETEEKTAKYVNSPETDLYNKSEILYGFDKAKQEIRKTNTCILVEGQMDLVLSHQAGITNTVAVSGTALSEFHLGFIHRIAENLVIAFDADPAGISAAGRGIGLALSEGFEVNMVALPDGKDPADVIREDPEVWKEAVSKAKHVVDFYIEYCVAKGGGSALVRRNIEAYVLPYIARLSSEIDKAQFVAKIAEILHISESPIWEEVHKVKIVPLSDGKETSPLARPASRKRNIEEKIIGVILSQEGIKEALIDVVSAKKRFEDITGREFGNEDGIEGPERGRLIFEAEVYCNKEQTVEACLEGFFNSLKREALREKVAFLRGELSKKDRRERTEEELLRDIQETQREIEALGKDENSP